MDDNGAKRTHIYFLLDRSGSMASMADDVIGGFNTFLASQRADGDDALMTLVQFDSEDPFEVLADACPLAELVELTPATFQPRGATPLLDATGRVIAHAAAREAARANAGDPAEDVIVVTFTDGHENQSCEVSLPQLRTLVAERERKGWTFVFLGADASTYDEAGGIGYDAGSTQSWAPDGLGARAAFASLDQATLSRRRRSRKGQAAESRDFFEGSKSAEEDRRRRHG